MDEDELLYREMNEEDPWYMGDDLDDEEEYEDEEEDDEYLDDSDGFDGEDPDYEDGPADEEPGEDHDCFARPGTGMLDAAPQPQGHGCCLVIPLFLIAVVSAMRIAGLL